MQPLSSLLPKPDQIGDIIAKFEVGSTQQSTGYIKVYNQSGIELHDADFNYPVGFLKSNGKSVDAHNWLAATIIPTRTGNCKDFAKDLFLPTLINQAIEIDDLAIAIFASIAALILDLITLIPRIFIAAPIKCIYDHFNKEPTHPLNQLTDSNDSQFKIEIYREGISTFTDSASSTAQRINWWVRTKAKPEDKDKQQTHNLMEVAWATYRQNPNDKTWAYLEQPGGLRPTPIETLTDAINEIYRCNV